MLHLGSHLLGASLSFMGCLHIYEVHLVLALPPVFVVDAAQFGALASLIQGCKCSAQGEADTFLFIAEGGGRWLFLLATQSAAAFLGRLLQLFILRLESIQGILVLILEKLFESMVRILQID